MPDPPTRSQILELMASNLGFRSYAALLAHVRGDFGKLGKEKP